MPFSTAASTAGKPSQEDSSSVPKSNESRGFIRGPVRALVIFVVGYVFVDLFPVVTADVLTPLGLSLGDLADFALVFVLVVLYVELGSQANLWRSRALRVAYAAALLVMVQGHSIHLAANAIAGAVVPNAPGWSLIYFLDEHWGHTELHLSFLLLAAMFIRCGQLPQISSLTRVERLGLWVAALSYGLLLAGDAVEGQTVPFMLPGAIALAVWGAWPYLKRKNAEEGSVPLYRLFFAGSFAVTALALIAYGLAMGGYVQPSLLGEAAY